MRLHLPAVSVRVELLTSAHMRLPTYYQYEATCTLDPDTCTPEHTTDSLLLFIYTCHSLTYDMDDKRKTQTTVLKLRYCLQFTISFLKIYIKTLLLLPDA